MFRVSWRVKPGKAYNWPGYTWNHENSGVGCFEKYDDALTYAKQRSREILVLDYFVTEIISKVSSEQPPQPDIVTDVEILRDTEKSVW